MAADRNEFDKRKNGIYYTPEKLANYLANPLITGKTIRVLDPSYGEGSLLLAAEKIFKEKAIAGAEIELFGSDIHPVNGLLSHLPEANLRQLDFFHFETPLAFDVILSNPPYVRHQNQSRDLIKEYRSKYRELQFLSNSSDLWAYFLIKSVSHLREGGSIGLIIPWSFLQADYAQNIRIWLFDKFKHIKVLALNHPYFEEAAAQERVVIIWLLGKGKKTKKVEFAFAHDIDSKISYSDMEFDQWSSPKVVGTNNDLKSIFSRISSDLRFIPFNEVADTRIGIVTGANAYFVRKEQELIDLGFKKSQLLPIITSAKELPNLIKEGHQKLKRILQLSEEDEQRHFEFIKTGVSQEFHKRSHSKMRKPWYSIDPGRTPDAFFPYRVGRIPYLVMNSNKIQSTNSIHRIYFKDFLSECEKKWIHLSMLSIYGQISMEVNAKTYGRGMLKMEPRALGEVLIFKSKSKKVDAVYDKIIHKLGDEQKESALEMATDFIDDFLNIPKDLNFSVKKALENIRVTRKRC